jgi:hypothetical protein
MNKLSNQFFENTRNYKDKSRQRIYLKDIDCPQVWHDKLQDHIPPFLFYLNESTGDIAGPGAASYSTGPARRPARGIARAGDLMSSLPAEMRAENLMCYIGHEGTYTPSHREMCATMGHNIMVEASKDVGEDGKPERPGSSIWFMTESKDRNLVSEYWLSTLGHDIEVENHFAQVSAWKRAPFSVYVVEQRPGDFILIPPLAPHQVWNRGTRTMKVAWNRTTIETLEMAVQEALPKARIVCRDEQYKTKAIMYYTLMLYSNRLAVATSQAEKLPADAARQLMGSYKIKQLVKDFRRLLALFMQVLVSEMFNPDGPQEKCELLPFDSNVTCAYCRCNIFNRFLTCSNCKDALGHEDDEPYDVCLDCYAMGRSCGCISGLKWTEQFKWKELTQKYEAWRIQLINLDAGNATKLAPPLIEARRDLPHKTLAEVCREQLKRRPFTDIAKPKPDDEQSEEDIIVDDEGRVKKTVKKKPKSWLKTHSPCHVCCKRHPNWKSAKCTTCDKWWCYGALFRGADVMPLTIMQDPNWSCPHCKNACFAGACRKDPKQQPYEPKGTLLGHDTRRVADARSVECLVDFSVSNLTWLRDDDEDVQESVRIRRAREEARRAKEADPLVDDDDDEEGEGYDVDQSHVRFDYSPEDSLIDPQLMGGTAQSTRSKGKSAAMLSEDILSLSATHSGNGHVQTNAPEGYVSATTRGFVAPQASMYPDVGDSSYAYSAPQGEEEDEEGYQPISALLSGATLSNKRPQEANDDDDEINMEATRTKRRRISEDGTATINKPRNEATKQFEKEKVRKALEEAKKAGRFIAAQAALRGKKRIVRLQMPGPRLAQLLAQQAANSFHPVFEAPELDEEAPVENVLLRSDIAPKEKAKKKAPQNPNKMKIRVERDDDFSMRSERAQRTERRKRPANLDYEEVDVESDFESGQSDGDGVRNGLGQKKGKRTISSYIQNKHIDDPDLPDALPDNFKDSRSKKGKAPASRQDAPAREQMLPPARPKNIPQLDGGDDYDDEGDGVSDSDDDEEPTFEEQNRLAKLEALKMVEEEAAPPAPLHRSIFDNRNGKKIRVVSKPARTSLPLTRKG